MGKFDFLSVKPAQDYTLALVQPPNMPGGYTPQGSANVMRMRSDAPGIQPQPTYAKVPKPKEPEADPTKAPTYGDAMPSKVNGEMRYDAGDIAKLKKLGDTNGKTAATLLGG